MRNCPRVLRAKRPAVYILCHSTNEAPPGVLSCKTEEHRMQWGGWVLRPGCSACMRRQRPC